MCWYNGVTLVVGDTKQIEEADRNLDCQLEREIPGWMSLMAAEAAAGEDHGFAEFSAQR